MPDGECKSFPVCAEHLYPAHQIRLYLAKRDFEAALKSSDLYRALEGLVRNLALLISRK